MEDQRDPLLIPDLPPRRPGTPAARELQALRSMIAAALDPSPSGAAEDELTLGQVPCVICEVADPQATLLWFHGGGFRLGSARQSKAFGERLARATAATRRPRRLRTGARTTLSSGAARRLRCIQRGSSPLAWCLHPGRRLSWRWPGYCIDCGHGGGRQ